MSDHMNDCCEYNVACDVRNSAYEIIEMKRATYFGIAPSVKRICALTASPHTHRSTWK